jgi:nitric oxide synthase-interacting protein
MVFSSTSKPFSVGVCRGVLSFFVHRSPLEYIVHQKKLNARKMREYQKQLDRKQQEVDEQNAHEHQKKLNRFLEKEATYSVNQTVKTLLAGKGDAQPLSSLLATPKSLASTRTSTNDDDDLETPASASTRSLMSTMVAQQAKQLPSFWIPSLTPAAKKTEVKKPDQHVYCPISGKPISMKDLLDVKFKLANDVHPDKRPLVAIRDRYVCAVTGDLLGNSVPCAVLRTSGTVVTMDCVNRLIKLDMTDPITGEKMGDNDIIPMQRGGTGKNRCLQ